MGVNYKVENVRVGKMTNWDKLILEVKTDGTISVEEAFNQSVKILVDQFKALITLEEKEKEGKKEEKKEAKKDDKEKKEERKMLVLKQLLRKVNNKFK